MTLGAIAQLPVADLAAPNAHLWLWTTNKFLPDGIDLMKSWGFKFMIPIVWVKPSGFGAWWIHRTQSMLFGYKGKLDMASRLKPNVIFANAVKHSVKPVEAYELAEAVSHPDRVELFARNTRLGWDSIGNAIDGQDIFKALGA